MSVYIHHHRYRVIPPFPLLVLKTKDLDITTSENAGKTGLELHVKVTIGKKRGGGASACLSITTRIMLPFLFHHSALETRHPDTLGLGHAPPNETEASSKGSKGEKRGKEEAMCLYITHQRLCYALAHQLVPSLAT